MTNFDYIMENITVRDISLKMCPAHFTVGTIFDKAWYACRKHYSNLEGYQNKGCDLRDGAVNPFIHREYFDESLHLIKGHPPVSTYETWLAKQYNPDEWE